MSDDPTADFLAREKAALGKHIPRVELLVAQLTLLSGDDADLFASGSAPSAPSGLDAFPDFCTLETASTIGQY